MSPKVALSFNARVQNFGQTFLLDPYPCRLADADCKSIARFLDERWGVELAIEVFVVD